MSLIVMAAVMATAGPDLQALVDDFRAEQKIPGVSVVVSERERVVFAGGSGVADIESARPMTPGTLLYSGSLSKIFTAVLALQLVEAREIALADSVTGIGASSDITVAHLLTHSSGLEREGNFGYWFTADFPDTNSLADYLLRTELRTEPGTALHYSNVGYATLGLVIERTTGMSFGEALERRVLTPLAMHDSGVPGPVEGIATGYTPVGRIIPNERRPFAGVGRKVGDRHVREYHDARAMSPAFGVYTSAADLGRLGQFLLGFGGDDVLSVSMRQRMRTRQESGWGLGLKIAKLNGKTVARHDGWFAAHRAHLLLDLESGIGVAVLTNSDNGAPAQISERILDALTD